MDKYLKSFVNYLKKELNNNLAGVIIYGSYVKGYFDSEKSDYDIFVIFNNQVIDIKAIINKKFPKVSLQLYINLKDLEEKILNGGWNTYIALIYTGQILFQTPELISLKNKLAQTSPNISKLNIEQKKNLIEKLKKDTKTGEEKVGYVLNKFMYSSLLRKLQILYFLRTKVILLKFNDLLGKINDSFIQNNFKWLIQLERSVFDRNNNLVSNKLYYYKVLEEADLAVERELMK